MTSHHVNLATLTWLDRRQLWATTNRASSLGTSTVPVYPSTLGGQGSRPSVANRHFGPSLSWFVSAAVAVFSLALAFVLLLLAMGAALNLALGKLALSFDKTLATSAENPWKPAPRTAGLEPLCQPTNFANLVYSLVGGLDSTSAYAPACKAKIVLANPLCWEVGSLDLPLTGWASGLAVLNAGSPSFRSYLGEWRRLVDQSSAYPTSVSPQGYVQTTRLRLAPLGFKAQTGASSAGQFNGANSYTPNSAKVYSFYLSAPWVF